jgi:hypothetical protein
MIDIYKKTYRVILICMAVAISVQLIIATAFRPLGFHPLHGDWGAGFEFKEITVGAKPELLVKAVNPETPIGRTGVVVGDRIVDFNYRFWNEGVPPQVEFPLSIKKQDGTVNQATLKPDKPSERHLNYLHEVTRILIICISLIIGLLIGLSRGQTKASRWLALFLLTFSLSHSVSLGWLLLAGWTEVIRAILSVLIFKTLGVFWLTLGSQLDIKKIRLISYVFYILLTTFALLLLPELSVNLGLYTAQYELIEKWSGYSGTATILLMAALLSLSVYVWYSARKQGDPNLRDRVFWIVLSLGVFPLIPITGGVWGVFSSLFGSDSALTNGVDQLRNILVNVMPIGMLTLGFAILKKRIFNFSFVLNRALLYSFLSLSLLLAFYAAKGGLEAIIKPTTSEAGTAISAGVAFLIYLAFHHVYDHIKEYMEHWLFKSWHHNEQQLRGFVRRSAFIEDDDKLREGFLSALNDFGHGCDIAIFEKNVDNDKVIYLKSLGNNKAIPDVISGDDPWVLTLRDQESMVIPASNANGPVPNRLFPQFHRGELLGFVWIGSKSDGENWRPDEESVLSFAVQQIGLDRYALEVSRLSKELEREKMTTDLLKGIINSSENRTSL